MAVENFTQIAKALCGKSSNVNEITPVVSVNRRGFTGTRPVARSKIFLAIGIAAHSKINFTMRWLTKSV
jgi:hypothetical protein